MRIKTILVATALAASGSAGSAAVLDFNGANACAGTCANGTLISQSYGDTADVDVRYDRDVSTAALNDMSWWDANYSDLQGVAWGGSSDSSGRSGISFVALTSAGVTVGGFDFGSWPNVTRSTQFSVIDLGTNNVLFASPTLSISGVAHTAITQSWSSLVGIQIQWGPSSYNVGIDNIVYSGTMTTGAVPLPAGLPLLAGALGGLTLLQRRRRNS